MNSIYLIRNKINTDYMTQEMTIYVKLSDFDFLVGQTLPLMVCKVLSVCPSFCGQNNVFINNYSLVIF